MRTANIAWPTPNLPWLFACVLLAIVGFSTGAFAQSLSGTKASFAKALTNANTVSQSSAIKVQTQTTTARADVINPPLASGPTNEFHLARLVFDVNSQHGWGPGRPWWRIDWPEAEFHFLNGLERYTVIDHAKDSIHIELSDDAIFDYPWLFAQQAGRWDINDIDASRLGEYLLRGGFLLADDIHGPNDWNTFAETLNRALPGFSIEDINSDDTVINILYDLDKSIQIPGRRHIMSNDGNGQVEIRMPYSPHKWRGIRDQDGRWMVAINFNMDMGDSWEHANDPYYPLDMTSLGYRLGMNYVLYAITH